MSFFKDPRGAFKAGVKKIERGASKATGGYGKYINPVHQYQALEKGLKRTTSMPEPDAAAFAPEPFQEEMMRSEKAMERGFSGGQVYRTGKMMPAPGTGGGMAQVGGKTFQQMLAEQMTGAAPSIAERQMRAGMEQSQAAQQASLAGARGMSPALAQRMMAQQFGQQQAQLAQQAGIARLQEQQAAQASYASELARQDAMQRFYEAQRTGNFAAMQQAKQDLEMARIGQATKGRQQFFDVLGKAGETAATIYSGGAG